MQTVNLIITLGGPSVELDADKKSYIPVGFLKERLDKTVEIAKTLIEPTLFIMSGGNGKERPYPSSTIMKEYLISKGIKRDRILEEILSLNTYQNAEFSASVCEYLNISFKRLIVITSDYHVERSKILFERAFAPLYKERIVIHGSVSKENTEREQELEKKILRSLKP